MTPPAKSSSKKAFLLVEAALCAVIIATGLVMINRSLGSQLKAVRAVEDYDTLLSLAQGKLHELEAIYVPSVVGGTPPAAAASGTFDPPYEAYRWQLDVAPVDDPARDTLPLSQLTVSVRRAEPPAGPVRLTAVWPSDSLPEAWRQ
jgi:hypothetical protein